MQYEKSHGESASLSATKWGEGRGEVALGPQGNTISIKQPTIPRDDLAHALSKLRGTTE